MALSYVYAAMLLLSIVFSLPHGGAALSAAALEGAGAGVTLTLSLAGALCLWSGVAKLMGAGGFSRALSGLFRPFLGKLFPDAMQDGQASGFICANFTANLLGLGNAATPAGLRAAERLGQHGDAARGELCRLVVMNSASLQLFPATVGALRHSLGAAAPFDILPAVWAVSLLSVSTGLLAERLGRP